MNNRVFLDADTVLDMAIASRPGHKAAFGLLDAIERNSINASVCATDLPTIQAALEDAMGAEDAALYLQALIEAFDVSTVSEGVCRQAMQLEERSFSDSVLQVCAEKASVDYIISPRSAAFKKSNIKVIDAGKFLQQLVSD